MVDNKRQNVLNLPIVLSALIFLLSLGEGRSNEISIYEVILGSLIIIMFFLSLFKFLIL